MSGSYDLYLVLLSVTVAAVGAYAALYMADRVAMHRGLSARIWVLVSGLTLGLAIWSMHFVGMLAFELPIAVTYDPWLTLLSLVVAVIAAGGAFVLVNRPRLATETLLLGGALIGSGICTMHYIGMAAMRIAPAPAYDPWLVLASLAIALLASIAGLWLAMKLLNRISAMAMLAKLGGAVLLGTAISGMHYMGMAAADFEAGTTALAGGTGTPLPPEMLARLISAVSIAVLLVILMISGYDAQRAGNQARVAASLRADNEHLRNIALHDPLTGLTNRVLLEDRLLQEIRHAERHGGSLAVLFIDLDDFKPINDAYGHHAGDQVLVELGQRLADNVRRCDTVARLGGDEFVVVLGGLRAARDAAAISNKLCRTLAEPLRVDGRGLQVSCSIGISLYPQHGRDMQALLASADAAMYAAKAAGRNGHAFYRPGMQADSQQRAAASG